MRVAYLEVIQTLEKILLKNGFAEDRAVLCSYLFGQASLDGVASHGLDRFTVFLEMIRKKLVRPNQKANLLDSYGVFERWNGNLGPGPLNAHQCMDRAIQISKEFGVGIVALAKYKPLDEGGELWLAGC
jgi:3-dehydro-L-gulonate 2-dehydrogenase